MLSLLGGRKGREAVEEHEVKEMPDVSAFGVEERNMVSGVLTLAERSIRSVMTPRGDVSWVNLNDSSEKMLQLLRDTPHSMIPVCNDDWTMWSASRAARTSSRIWSRAARSTRTACAKPSSCRKRPAC